MLKITVPEAELFDSDKGEFMNVPAQTLSLEHSLLSISKWESKWHKAFFGKQEKTNAEIIDYIRCMTLTPNVSPLVYLVLTQDNMMEVGNYIDDPMTATWFSKENTRSNNETITSELIYYWMIALQIPFDPCQKWHINRLLTLIRVCNAKNAPAKKMSKGQMMAQNRSLNRQRRNMRHSKG